MRKLTINDIPVALTPGHSVKLTRGNVLFDKKDSFSLPIELSLDVEQNRKAIKYLHKLQVAGNRSQTFNALFSKAGVPLLKGPVSIREMSNRYTELPLKGNGLAFDARAKAIQIKDLPWPEIAPFSWAAPVTAAARAAAIQTELGTCITSHKPYTAFPLVNMTTNKAFINDWDFVNQVFTVPEDNATTVDMDGETFTRGNSVFFRVYAVMEKLFSMLGYEVKENYFSSTDDLKDLVMPNASRIEPLHEKVYWHHFLPNVSVYQFLDDWRSAGIKFDIDNTLQQVYITTPGSIKARTPQHLAGMVKDSIKITPEKPDGYVLTINKDCSYPNQSFKHSFMDNYDLVEQHMGNAVATEDDLPNFIVFPLLVKATGVMYGVGDTGLDVVPVTTKTQKKTSGAQETSIDVKVCPVGNGIIDKDYSYTDTEVMPQVEYVHKFEMAAVYIDHGPDETNDYSTTALMLTVYRGGQQYRLTEGTDLPVLQRWGPHASYLPYNVNGWDTANTLALDSAFFYGIYAPHIQLMENSYPIELKFMGQLTDFLEFPFNTRLVEGQRLFIEALTFACRNNQDEIEYTLTGRMEQTAETDGIEVGQLYEQVNLESQSIDLENDLIEL